MSEINVDILRRFSLYLNGKRFNATEFARFLKKEIGGEFQILRRLAKSIMVDAVSDGHMTCLDGKRGLYRMAIPPKVWPDGIIDKHGVVGKHFSTLKIIDLHVIEDADFRRCIHCGYEPKTIQFIYLINTPYGDTKVLMCPSCNKVLTELEDE